MNSTQRLLWIWIFFQLYAFAYIFLYLFYNLIIDALHSSFSVVSVPAVVIPYLIILMFQITLWKRTDKHVKSDWKIKIKFSAIAILSLIPPLYCTVLLGINEYNSYFSVEKWLNNETERVHMVDNLLKKYELNGMAMDEVTTLLGEPTGSPYFETDNNIVYYLGNERGLISIDSEWLVIDFDDNEKVVKYEIARD